MIVRATTRLEAEHFTFAGGLFRAHVADGVPLKRLAAEYGMSLPLLRDRLTAYVATCCAALEWPEVEAVAPPSPPPPAPPPGRMRIRERIEVPATVPAPCSPLKRGAAGVAARQRKAANRAVELKSIVAEIRAAGAVSLRATAGILNSRGVTAPQGGKWCATQVRRVEARTAGGEQSCR